MTLSLSANVTKEWADEQPQGITLLEAMAIARRSAESLSNQKFDSIAHSERQGDGTWLIVVDTIEAKARMGNNDLIAAWSVTLAADGELLAYSRQRRYNREGDKG